MATRTAPKPSKPLMSRYQVYLDPQTIKILDKIARTTFEIKGRSAAIRLLAHRHATRKDVTA